jgi:hypothetical protein
VPAERFLLLKQLPELDIPPLQLGFGSSVEAFFQAFARCFAERNFSVAGFTEGIIFIKGVPHIESRKKAYLLSGGLMPRS